VKLSRTLRKNATGAEAFLWQLLRNRAFHEAKFRRQHPVGEYVLDFYCHEAKLGIELDGSGHLKTMQSQHDRQRAQKLAADGITVLRFWNSDVLNNTEQVLEEMWVTLDRLLPGSGEAEMGESEGQGHSLTRPSGRALRAPSPEGGGEEGAPSLTGLAEPGPGSLLPFEGGEEGAPRAGSVEGRPESGGRLAGKTVAALGLAYKPDVDDLRESPAIEAARLIQEDGARVLAYEPYKPDAQIAGLVLAPTLVEAIEEADALLLLVGHTPLRKLNPYEVAQLTPARVVIDTVNGWPAEEWEDAGFHYYQLGNGQKRR
jgi:very-short-patch-repair endonuclease